MAFFARIFRFLFWLLIVSWAVALLRRIVGWMLRSETGTAVRSGGTTPNTVDAAGISRRLVRDPICGIHVSEHIAIPYRESGELVHFCSVNCRDQYVNQTRRKAANA